MKSYAKGLITGPRSNHSRQMKSYPQPTQESYIRSGAIGAGTPDGSAPRTFLAPTKGSTPPVGPNDLGDAKIQSTGGASPQQGVVGLATSSQPSVGGAGGTGVVTLGRGSGGGINSTQPSGGAARPQRPAGGASSSGSGAAGGGSSSGSGAVGGGPSSGSGAAGEGSSSGNGAAGSARYYAPASHSSKTACGRYPYPPCK